VLPVVTILKALTELVLLTMIGQAVLWLLAGSSREQNLIYGAFRIITRPIFGVFRAVTPKIVLDRHIPLIAFFWLALLWGVLIVAIAHLKGVIDLFA
jgi:hypothetical protein